MIATKDAMKVRHLRRVNVGRRLRQNGRCSGHFSGVVLILCCSNIVAALVVCDPLCGGVTPLRSQGRRLVVIKVVLVLGCSKEPAPDRIAGVGSTVWVRVNRGEPRVEDTVKLGADVPSLQIENQRVYYLTIQQRWRDVSGESIGEASCHPAWQSQEHRSASPRHAGFGTCETATWFQRRDRWVRVPTFGLACGCGCTLYSLRP
jgi:hypothetical protein